MEATHPKPQVDPENPSKMEGGGGAWQDEQEEAWLAKEEAKKKDWEERTAQAMEDVSPRLHEQAGAKIAANRAIERQIAEDSRAFSRGVAQVREEIARKRKAAEGGPSRRREAAGEGFARLTASEKSQPVSEQLLDPQTGTSETKSYEVLLISEGKIWDSSAAAQIFLNEDKLVVQSEGKNGEKNVVTMNYSDIKYFGPRKKDPDKENPSTMRIDSEDGSKIKIEFYDNDGNYPDYYNLKSDLEFKTSHVQRQGGGKKSRRKSRRKSKRKYTKRRKSTKRKYTKRRKSKTRRRRR